MALVFLLIGLIWLVTLPFWLLGRSFWLLRHVPQFTGWVVRQTSLLDIFAVGLVGIAVILGAAWHWHRVLPASHFVAAWAPNLSTSLISLALGIAVIERALNARERRRNAPRRTWAELAIAEEFTELAAALRTEFRQQYPEAFAEARQKLTPLLSHWIKELENAIVLGRGSWDHAVDEVPTTIGATLRFATRAGVPIQLERDLLDAALVAAVERAGHVARDAERIWCEPNYAPFPEELDLWDMVSKVDGVVSMRAGAFWWVLQEARNLSRIVDRQDLPPWPSYIEIEALS
jgi:hypothetical protein